MSVQDFESFKEKLNLTNEFIEIVDSLFDKLLAFGYINRKQRQKLIDRLYDNVNSVSFGEGNLYDYKSGYYDANQKRLYIKDITNIPAVYLRLLYAMNSIEIGRNTYTTGFAITKMRTDSYKMEYINFGLNRAVMSNLVSKIYNSLPVSIAVPTKEYTHNFLGYKITANNDIYSVEGKILSELCFALDIDEEIFFEGLFSKKPLKFLNKVFKKKGFYDYENFLKVFDDISRTYNKYNKVCYLSKLLNENYLAIKKNALNGNNEELLSIKRHIETTVITVVNEVLNRTDEDYEEIETPIPAITEATEFLESSLIDNLNKLQEILSDKIITTFDKLSPYLYASKLHQFCNMLIKPNQKLKEAVRDTILYKLIPKNEIRATNIIQKIRYAIILDLLSTEKFTDISKNFSFHTIQELINEEKGLATIIVTANKSFARMVEIGGLDKKLDDMQIEVEYIPLDNLQYIMNSDFSNMYVNEIEKLYTNITTKFEYFKGVSLANMYMFDYAKQKFLIIYKNGKPYVAKVTNKNEVTLLEVSDSYKIFDDNSKAKKGKNKALPTLVRRH